MENVFLGILVVIVFVIDDDFGLSSYGDVIYIIIGK